MEGVWGAGRGRYTPSHTRTPFQTFTPCYTDTMNQSTFLRAAVASISMKAWYAVGKPIYDTRRHLERFRGLCEDICKDEIGVRLVAEELDDVQCIDFPGFTGIALEYELVRLSQQELRSQLHEKTRVWESMHARE